MERPSPQEPPQEPSPAPPVLPTHRRRARRSILGYLKWVRRLCRAGRSDLWEEATRRLQSLLAEHGEALPPAVRARLHALAETPLEAGAGLESLCKELQSALEKALSALPAPFPMAGVALSAVLAVGAVVGGGLAYLGLQTPAQVVVRNEGCGPLALPGAGLLDRLPGVDLPAGPIPEGGEGAFRLPPITVRVDATHPGEVALQGIGVRLAFPAPRLGSVQVDGEEVMGRTLALPLQGGRVYRVVLSCR